jgi:hypothetical protein
MPATVEAAFRLINRSKGPMDEIKRDATVVTTKTKEMGNSADTAARKYEASMERTKRATSGAVRASSADLDKLLLKLKEVEHTRANAKVDVDITAAEAKLRILRQEIRKVSTAEARKELTDLGLVADTTTTKLAGGGGGRGGGGGGLAAGFAEIGRASPTTRRCSSTATRVPRQSRRTTRSMPSSLRHRAVVSCSATSTHCRPDSRRAPGRRKATLSGY